MVKKLTFGLLLLAIIFGVNLPFAKADLPPPDSHSVTFSPRVMNLDQYPSISIISFTESRHPGTTQAKIVIQGEVIIGSTLLWGDKNYISNMDLGNMTATSLTTDPNLHSIENYYLPDYTEITESIGAVRGTVPNSNPLTNVILEYSLKGSPVDGQLSLYKSKQIFKFNNGSPDEITLFDQNGNEIGQNGGGVINSLFNSKYWLAIGTGLLIILIVVVAVVLGKRKKDTPNDL